MPALQVRDFPEDLYEQLRASAKNEHRSIAQQTIVAVKYYLINHTEPDAPFAMRSRNETKVSFESRYSAEERRERFDRVIKSIQARPPFEDPEGFSSIVELIREDRDSR